jgi:RNA polymerase sigma-70 factor (ECF subfamily)
VGEGTAILLAMSARPADAAGASASGSATQGATDELLQRVGAGDQTAFAAVYDALSARVFGLARHILRDTAQAEEVTQEAFLDVWRTAAKYDPARSSAATWVLTIAHRRAVDRVRSAQAAADRDARVAMLEQTPEFDEVAEAVESLMEAEQVRRCLEGLTSLQRESLSLAYFGGHTYAQVATLLGLPLGTVKTRLRDGLARLRNCLGAPA